ncbi:calmodulin-binding family protein [Tripterygium wilfordii]|uniref:Calmodulin-binding family protein n=1 Tax=Tripterygium wilfordii TaxID=458696 RepID=A0A7J7DK22_TRIWF|nr:calmodulin-binding family protein [Tripterygium wilfordii]
MSQQGYDINSLFQEAQSRWLKPAEVLYVLQNHEKYQFTQEPPQRPTSGSLFLFNKRILRFFRRDGHNWRKKKDGRTVGEAHERLKVANVEALNCYYAHGEENPNFQRRSYWMLDAEYEHIVLVHYREITEGRPSPGSAALLSPGASSTLSPSPRSYTTNYPSASSATSDLHEPCQTLSSPASIEVSSEKVNEPKGVDGKGKFAGSSNLEVTLRRLEEQLSLNEESLKEVGPFSFQETEINGSELLDYGTGLTKQNHYSGLFPQTEEYAIHDQFFSGLAGMQDPSNSFVPLQDAGNAGEHPHQSYSFGRTDGSKESLSWNELLETCRTSSISKLQEEQLSSSRRELADQQEHSHWPNFSGPCDTNFTAPMLLSQEEEKFKIHALSSTIENHETSSDYYAMLFDQGSIPLEAGSRVTIAQKQRFTIQAVSPEWGYTDETTKIIVVGSFDCDPGEFTWTCMFGDNEVPIQIIQDGVIRCEAPPHPPGKVTLCITTGNRESCSEVREFEYRGKTSSCTHCNFSQTEATKSPEELLLLVRFVQMLLSDSSKQNIDSSEPRKYGELKADNDMWGHIIEALLFGNGAISSTVDWLIQELLKDKLPQWLASRTREGCEREACLLSKNEQGIIHMVAGLGYEWALNPILSHGVSINFRDISGWTALHWAARFGRYIKM